MDRQTEQTDDAPQAACPLCGRPLGGIVNRHHLVPISKGGAGSETVEMHKICHDKIHSLFAEKELKRYYHTIPRLLENEQLRAFLQWVRKRPPEFYDGTAKKK